MREAEPEGRAGAAKPEVGAGPVLRRREGPRSCPESWLQREAPARVSTRKHWNQIRSDQISRSVVSDSATP